MVEIVLGLAAILLVTALLIRSMADATAPAAPAAPEYRPVKHEWASRIDWDNATRIEHDPDRKDLKRRSAMMDRAYRPFVEAQRPPGGFDWERAPRIGLGAGSRSTDRRVEREAREASPSRYAAQPTPAAACHAATSSSDAGLNVPLALAYGAAFSASFSDASSASSPACDTSSSASVDCGSF
jgi:hypothetical protein